MIRFTHRKLLRIGPVLIYIKRRLRRPVMVRSVVQLCIGMLPQHGSGIYPQILCERGLCLCQIVLLIIWSRKRRKLLSQDIDRIWNQQHRAMSLRKRILIHIKELRKALNIPFGLRRRKAAGMLFDQIIIIRKINILALLFHRQTLHVRLEPDPCIPENKLIRQIALIIRFKCPVQNIFPCQLRHLRK